MPPISPCGMAVEWVRSCHQGGWRFYANALGVITQGRYYFVKQHTPHLPFLHDFGAFAWRNGDPEPDVRLGEVANYPRKWTNGRLGIPLPPPLPLGDRGQFEGELSWPVHAPPDQFPVMGIPSTCWTQAGSGTGAGVAICALDSCCLQTALARCVELAYQGDSVRLTTFFTAWLGAATVCYWFPVAGVLPARMLVKHPALTIWIVSGTTSFQQFAIQAFQSALGPTDFGAYATLPLWNDLASRLSLEMQAAGCNASAPILLAGHSYGAAAATVLGARIRLDSATRDVCVMTFGLPKPGDARLRELLLKIDTLHVSNDDDLVTAIPPNGQELAPFVPLIGQPLLFLWDGWKQPSERWVVDKDGNGAPREPNYLDAEVLGPLIANVLASQQIAVITGHRIAEYVRRLYNVCPDPCFPMNLALWRILFGRGGVEMGGASPGRGGAGGVEMGGAGVLGGERGSGGVELGGAGVVAPSPGGTCGTAGTMTLGTPFTYTIGVGAFHWFTWAVAAGTQYYVKVTLNSGSLGGVIVETGTCASPTFEFSLSPSPSACNTFTKGSATNGYVQITGPISGTANYTIQVGTGACPP